MKIYCISDNTDTQVGLRLCGIDGVVLHNRDEILSKLDELIEDENIAIVLMTTKVVNECADVISNYKLTLRRPLLVEISDRHGSMDISKTIDKYISEAVGIKI